MENVNGSGNTESSFLGKISTLFGGAEKQEPQSRAKDNVILTAFRTIPEKTTRNNADKGNDDPAGEGNLRNGAVGPGEYGDPEASDTEEGRDGTQGGVDTDLVKVRLVEIHSDTETEDDEGNGLVQSEQVGNHGTPCSEKGQGRLGAAQAEPVTLVREGLSDACEANATPGDEGREVPTGTGTPNAAVSQPTPPAASMDACTLPTSLPSAMPNGSTCPSEHSPKTAVDCSLGPAKTKLPAVIEEASPGSDQCPPAVEDQMRAHGRLPPIVEDPVCASVDEDVVNEGSTDAADGSPVSQEFPDTPAAQAPSEPDPGVAPEPMESPSSSQDTEAVESHSETKEGQCSQGCSSDESKPASIPPQAPQPGSTSRSTFRRSAVAQSSPRDIYPLGLRALTQIFSLDKKEPLNDGGDKADSKEATDPPAAEGKDAVTSDEESKPESAFEAFKSFFTSKSIKRRTEPPDLQVVREKMRNEQEMLRAIFDRSPSKAASPENTSKSEVTPPGDGEERTPGRLQAVWPPPRPKDVEEKVGLKYTEAEHQAALLQLKRESKEELEKLRVQFERQIFKIRGEHALSISQLEEKITEMQQELANSVAKSCTDCREVGVSTEDGLLPKSFRNVCVQTDRETFIKPPEEDRRPSLSPTAAVPKKLNLSSISQSLLGKAKPASGPVLPPPPSPSSKSCQSGLALPPLAGSLGLAPFPTPPLTPPSVSSPPPPPSTPSVSSTPSTPTTPSVSSPPPTPTTPSVSSIPSTPTTPSVSSPPSTPTTPSVSSPPSTPTTPSVSSTHSTPTTPSVSSPPTPPPPPPLPGYIPPPAPPLPGCGPPPPPPLPGFGPPPPPPLPGCGPPPPPPLPGYIPPLAPPPPGCGPPPPPPLPGFGPPPPPPLPGCGPPPPLPLPGFGPPPPPPIGGSSFSPMMGRAPRKPVVEPACPMKPLYWARIQVQDNNCTTLWGSLEEPDILNPQEFEELFSKATPQPTKKRLSEVFGKKPKAERIKLLDGKRSQAVGILISSLHLEMKDIQQALLNVDNSVVDLEIIEALYENRAQNEELEKMKQHFETAKDDKVKLLDKPEQFLYELAQIPDFSDRAYCIIFRGSFSDGVSSIGRKVEIVSEVCECLLNRTSVRDVLGLVLAFGNYMNGGNRTRGQADGFSLEILPKLKDVKSRDSRMSLVDYVATYYLRNFDKNTGTEKSVFPLPEPQDLFLAAQVKFEDLSKDLKKLQSDLAGCEKKIQEVCLSSSEEHLEPFKEKMESFVSVGKKDYDAVHDKLTSAQKSFQDMVEYFGVKPKSGEKEVAPGFVFMLWFEFCNDFKTAWEQETRNISNASLKAARKSVKMITDEKKVETKKINSNSLKKRMRLKEATLFSS